jgi:hypothetical protein
VSVHRVTNGVNFRENRWLEIRCFLAIVVPPSLHPKAFLVILIVIVAKCLRMSLWVAQFGREAISCKEWPSATASGGCGLDKGLPPDPVRRQQIDGEFRSQI